MTSHHQQAMAENVVPSLPVAAAAAAAAPPFAHPPPTAPAAPTFHNQTTPARAPKRTSTSVARHANLGQDAQPPAMSPQGSGPTVRPTGPYKMPPWQSAAQPSSPVPLGAGASVSQGLPSAPCQEPMRPCPTSQWAHQGLQAHYPSAHQPLDDNLIPPTQELAAMVAQGLLGLAPQGLHSHPYPQPMAQPQPGLPHAGQTQLPVAAPQSPLAQPPLPYQDQHAPLGASVPTPTGKTIGKHDNPS